MSKNIIFRNPGLLSLIDLTTMGDSTKRADDSKIGKFDSGLKYAIALLVRNDIEFEIRSGNTRFNVSTTIIHDHTTKKSKELLVIEEYDCLTTEGKSHITAFSPQLGYNWELWQAFRELYANTLDEKGTVEFIDSKAPMPNALEDETVIIINSNPLVENIINHWNDYFLPVDLKPLTSYHYTNVYKNPNGTLKLYKQGILIYKDDNVKSRYIYSYEYASIDERRTLNDLSGFKDRIVNCISESTNVSFLEGFLSNNDNDLFESKLEFYFIYSDTLIEVANRLYKESKLTISNSMKEAIMSHSKSDIGMLKLRHTKSHDYSSVKVEPVESDVMEVDFEEIPFEEKIITSASKFNIKVEYKITESKISGFKVMADSFRKTLFVDSNFDEKEDMWQLVKAIYSLNKDRDAIFKDFINLKQKQ